MLDLLLDFSDIVGGCVSPYVCKSRLVECQFIVAHQPLDDNDVQSNGRTMLCIFFINPHSGIVYCKSYKEDGMRCMDNGSMKENVFHGNIL